MCYVARCRDKKAWGCVQGAVLADGRLFGSSVFDVISVSKVGTVQASEAVKSRTLYISSLHHRVVHICDA